MRLYKRQHEIYQRLLSLFKQSSVFNTYVLAGEMGVGKTYIASRLISDFSSAIVICPVNVVKKWQKVLAGFNNEDAPVVFSTSKKFDKEAFSHAKLKIVKKSQLSQFLSDSVYYDCIVNTDLLVVDEFHEYRIRQHGIHGAVDTLSTAYELLDKVIGKQRTRNKKSTLLLTGTPFNQKYQELLFQINLIYQEYDSIYASYCYLQRRLFSSNFLLLFMRLIWQEIAVTVSINEVEDATNLVNNEKIDQELKLEWLPMTGEQDAFYNLLRQTLSTSERDGLLISSFLDDPNQPLIKKKRRLTAVVADSPSDQIEIKLAQACNSLLGLKLLPIPFSQTNKFKRLLKILATRKRAIVIVENSNIQQTLCQNLINKNINAGLLPKTLKKSEYAEWINRAFNTRRLDVLIVKADDISVGIDLNCVDTMIWYQLIGDVAKVLQTQRRIYRLNSSVSSQVYYLVYKNTIQEELITQIANASRNNAATYGVQNTDPLAKLAGILLGDVQNEN